MGLKLAFRLSGSGARLGFGLGLGLPWRPVWLERGIREGALRTTLARLTATDPPLASGAAGGGIWLSIGCLVLQFSRLEL